MERPRCSSVTALQSNAFFITALLEPCTVFLIFIPFGTIISAWHCVPGHQTGKHPIGQRGPRGADRLWVEQGVPG